MSAIVRCGSTGDGPLLGDEERMVGVDAEVVHGFVNCGATGAIAAIGHVLPGEVLHLVALGQRAIDGDVSARRRAQVLEAALGMLSSFDEGAVLLLHSKSLTMRRGDAGSAAHRNESDKLSVAQAQRAKSQLELFKRW